MTDARQQVAAKAPDRRGRDVTANIRGDESGMNG